MKLGHSTLQNHAKTQALQALYYSITSLALRHVDRFSKGSPKVLVQCLCNLQSPTCTVAPDQIDAPVPVIRGGNRRPPQRPGAGNVRAVADCTRTKFVALGQAMVPLLPAPTPSAESDSRWWHYFARSCNQTARRSGNSIRPICPVTNSTDSALRPGFPIAGGEIDIHK